MISIIIPVYREQGIIDAALDALMNLEAQQLIKEIIVVQSEGETYHHPTLMSSKRARSAQLNIGGRHATGDILLFLHADTRLPDHALRAIVQKKKGAFSLKFDSASLSAKGIGYLTTLRSKIFRSPYGDQAFFMPKSTFDQVGGFDEVPILEDVLMAQKLHLPILKSCVTSSFRRYEEQGIIKTVLKHRYIMLRYCLGSRPETLCDQRKP